MKLNERPTPGICHFYRVIVCMDQFPTDFLIFDSICQYVGSCPERNKEGDCNKSWRENYGKLLTGSGWCAASNDTEAFKESCKASCGACGI